MHFRVVSEIATSSGISVNCSTQPKNTNLYAPVIGRSGLRKLIKPLALTPAPKNVSRPGVEIFSDFLVSNKFETVGYYNLLTIIPRARMGSESSGPIRPHGLLNQRP